jgi:hypothetical protein
VKKVIIILTVTLLTAVFFFSSCTDDGTDPPPSGDCMVLADYGLMVMRKDLGNSTWSGACDMCKQLRLDGFTDWRLPSQGELAILYNERNIIGGFETKNNTQYWSSTPHAIKSGFYMCLNFTNGHIGDYLDMPNQQPLAVRCVRSIAP